MTAHDRWKAFRGKSTDDKDLIFSLRNSSLIQFKTKFHVFLANNTKEDVPDFRIKDSWFERSCVIYAGESDNIVAQVISINKLIYLTKLRLFLLIKIN